MKYLVKIVTSDIIFVLRIKENSINYELLLSKIKKGEDEINHLELVISNEGGNNKILIYDNNYKYKDNTNYLYVNNDLQFVEFEISSSLILNKLMFYFEDEIKITKVEE